MHLPHQIAEVLAVERKASLHEQFARMELAERARRAKRDRERQLRRALDSSSAGLQADRLVIRRATGADAAALVRLAELDSARLPVTPLLVAEVDGELWAAVPLDGGAAIADPFHPTAEIVSLLALRATQVRLAERIEPGPRPRLGLLRRTIAPER